MSSRDVIDEASSWCRSRERGRGVSLTVYAGTAGAVFLLCSGATIFRMHARASASVKTTRDAPTPTNCSMTLAEP
jgi:hypothetical protein